MSNEDEEGRVSKSRLKREMQALHAIGEKLVSYNNKQLAQFDLSEELTVAIQVAKKITSRLALSRQIQYIGRLMRSLDIVSIEKTINRIEQTGTSYLVERNRAEAWRTRLLQEDNQAITDFVNEFEEVEIQQLRQLVREAKKEMKAEKPGGASNKLFRLVYSQIIK